MLKGTPVESDVGLMDFLSMLVGAVLDVVLDSWIPGLVVTLVVLAGVAWFVWVA